MIRRWNRLPAYAVGAIFLGPVFALLPACFVDSGSDGRLRLSFFSIAITLLDPFVWTCVWNSLAVAAVVTGLSALGGVVIGRIIHREGVAANGSILFLASAGMAIPPLYASLGWLEVFRSVAPNASNVWSASWAALVLSELTLAVPFVALVATIALRRVDPIWEESARLVGATPRKIWRKLIWPVARPEVARALSLVFALSLLEPGSPSLLGLRRTIGFQIVHAAREGGLIGRASAFTLLAFGLATVGRLLLGWWGGMPSARPTPSARAWPRSKRPLWSAFARLSPVFVIVVFVSGLPALGLLRGFESGTSQSTAGGLTIWTTLVEEPWIRSALVNSAWLGALVVVIDLGAVKLLTAGVSESYGRERLARLARHLEAIPPVVLGMGVFVVPELLRILLGTRSPRGLLEAVDARSGSWLPLALSVAALRFSVVGRSRVEDSWELRPACLDSFRLAGASPHRRPAVGWGGVSFAAILLTFSLAANSVAPALLPAPTAETRPIGPAILILSDAPQPNRGAAFALALIGVGLNSLALIGMAREWKTRPREPL